jgi:NAD+ kinase
VPDKVTCAALFTHGRPERIGDAETRVHELASEAGVELTSLGQGSPDLVVALGGDGTMLRALRATLGAATPVFGVNFGRMGFLTSAEGHQLEEALRRVFAGEYKMVELCTLAASLAEGPQVAVNDVVVTSAEPGRMVELGWEVGGEELGSQPCDGLICCTPSGSTAYNLSNGGPVMMWGLEAMAITFVAPHSLHARPLVLPRGHDLNVTNRSAAQHVTVLVDGKSVGDLAPGAGITVSIGEETASLAVLPEVSFLHPLPLGVPLDHVLRSLRIENFVLIREADLGFGPRLNAVTGETGAGKTILAQAIGLLLGAPGDSGYLGPGASEAYVEADFDLPQGILEDEELATLAELRPEEETGLVAARRVFADGRTRAYAWGRAVPREDLAALVERLLAMSGQFEQRRLARPSFQLDVLDAFVGEGTSACAPTTRAPGESSRPPAGIGTTRERGSRPRRAAGGAAAACRADRGSRTGHRGRPSLGARAPPSRHRAGGGRTDARGALLRGD